MNQLLIKNAHCVSTGGEFETDILIDEGRIVEMGENLSAAANTVIDAAGRWVLPGGVDVHVHLPWPTGEVISQDDFDSGTLSAAFGGTTLVIDLIVPEDDESLSQALQRKMETDRDLAWVDYSYHLNIRGDVPARLKEVPELILDGFPSYKAFMAYEGFRLEDQDLIRTLLTVSESGGVLMVHAENGHLADFKTAWLVNKQQVGMSNYPLARPIHCEIEAIHRILSYLRSMRGRLHIAHVSTERGVEMIGRARASGLSVTGETCPHYLLLDEERYRGDPAEAAYVICAPSIKSQRDQAALWKGLANGSLSLLSTDHCPYSKVQKEVDLGDFTKVPGGMAGVETRLPLIFTEGVIKGRLTASRFVDVWATGPAKAFGLFPKKGTIAIGSDADLVMFDPAEVRTLDSSKLHMKTDCYPFEGWQVNGSPVTTVLRGEIIVHDGQLKGSEPLGQLIKRKFMT
jgi:dihydropyrimidinase